MTWLQLSVSRDPTFLIGWIKVSQKERMFWVDIFSLRLHILKSKNKNTQKYSYFFVLCFLFNFFFIFFTHFITKWFFYYYFFFLALNLTQIELAFQKVFQEIWNKRKNIFKKANYFFLVFAHRFWGYTFARKDRWKALFFFDNPIILTNICLLQALKKMPLKHFFQYKKEQKPTKQAVWTDPSRCNSTNKKNPPMQQNCHNYWISHAILMALKL